MFHIYGNNYFDRVDSVRITRLSSTSMFYIKMTYSCNQYWRVEALNAQ